jgi:hypothetical protein
MPLIAAILLLLLAAAPAPASTIVYSCDVNLCSVDPDTGKRRAITRDGTGGTDNYADPWLSSDGRLLVFWQQPRVYVGDRRARNRRSIPAPPGRRGGFYFPQLRTGSHEAFYFHGFFSDRFISARMCRTPDLLRGRPRCGSFDRRTRAYWAWGPNRTIVSVDGDLRQDICVTDLDGRCRKVLVRLKGDATFFMRSSTSPDDRTIVAAVDTGGPEDETRLVAFDARTGRQLRALTRGHNDYPPSYSPDGRWIAFRRDAHWLGDRLVGSICIVPSRGGGVRCLVRNGKEPGFPVWGG